MVFVRWNFQTVGYERVTNTASCLVSCLLSTSVRTVNLVIKKLHANKHPPLAILQHPTEAIASLAKSSAGQKWIKSNVKSMEKIQARLKSEKNTSFFTWRSKCTYDNTSLNYSRTEKLHMKLLERIKIQTSCSECRSVYEIVTKMQVQPEVL